MSHSGENMEEGGAVVVPLERQQTAIHGDSTSAPLQHTGKGQILFVKVMENEWWKVPTAEKLEVIWGKNWGE